MTRVFGQLFADGRDGILAIKASKAFFGSTRDEQHYEVVAGSVDFDIAATPRGVFYNVGFKDLGDTRATAFTLKWTIPPTGSVDVGPKQGIEANSFAEQTSSPIFRVQVKRLASELSSALDVAKSLESEIADIKQEETLLRQKFDQYKRDSALVLSQRDQRISYLSMVQAPKVKTIYKDVPVAPKALEDRILHLEQQNQNLQRLNDTYYQAYLELYQLKLERAQSLPSPGLISSPEDSPRQRLINKLFNS